MSLILNIDTSLETAVVNIADNGIVIVEQLNPHQKNHSAFLENGINQILQHKGIQLDDLSAIALVAGPGSYTGLRIGMASVKALCYALQKPLILLNKLEVLTTAALKQKVEINESSLFCPMIDARRMEVFTAIYNHKLDTIMAPGALILEKNTFHETLAQNQMLFFGNGAFKWHGLCDNKNATFIEVSNEGEAMAALSLELFNNQVFADVIYASPLYLKEYFI